MLLVYPQARLFARLIFRLPAVRPPRYEHHRLRERAGIAYVEPRMDANGREWTGGGEAVRNPGCAGEMSHI